MIHWINEHFRLGTRVRVIKQHKYMSNKLVGKVGSVVSNYGSEIRVDLDGMCNKYAASGSYYFKPSELEIITDDKACDNDVKESENMANITNYFNAVKIKFVGDSSPCNLVYANFEPDLKVDDLCVVKPAHHGLALARVTEILEGTSYETSREIVAKVFTEEYDARVANRAKVAEIKAKMQERAKQLQDIALYQMLAEKDPEMMDLLVKYNGLPKM